VSTKTKTEIDVVCLGEALVDLLPSATGQQARDVAAWHPCLGGAPANVAVGLSRLGRRAALVGVTGDDEFGHFLTQKLASERVDVSGFRKTHLGKTGLGFVSITQTGERSFAFYRVESAEGFIDENEFTSAKRLLKHAKVLHFGTNSLIKNTARTNVLKSVRWAQKEGHIVSVDPNLRLRLWKNPAVLQALLSQLWKHVSIVKLSDEEIEFATGTKNVDDALLFLEREGVALAIVTLGAKGGRFRFKATTVSVRSPKVKVVDTTGAGDGFVSGLLACLTKIVSTHDELCALDIAQIESCSILGCEIGSEVVTKMGAVAGLPWRNT
jgi:fructokinase